MPRAQNSTNDRIADYIAVKDELDHSIREAVAAQNAERAKIESLLKMLKHSDARAVIRMRYFDRDSWNGVTDTMFGSKEDFLGKEDTYLRRVHKIHGAALKNLAELSVSTQVNTKNPNA